MSERGLVGFSVGFLGLRGGCWGSWLVLDGVYALGVEFLGFVALKGLVLCWMIAG